MARTPSGHYPVSRNHFSIAPCWDVVNTFTWLFTIRSLDTTPAHAAVHFELASIAVWIAFFADIR